MSDTSFDSDAYAEGSSTEVGSERDSVGDRDEDDDSAERKKRNKTLVKATLNHNSMWATSVDILDREERCDDEAAGGGKSHPLANLVRYFLYPSNVYQQELVVESLVYVLPAVLISPATPLFPFKRAPKFCPKKG